MRIGLTGGGTSVDKVVEQAKQAEADGFTSLWYASLVTGDPLVAIAIAGRETSTIELGTAVLQTYPCHPLLQANRRLSRRRDGKARLHPRHRTVTRAADPRRVRSLIRSSRSQHQGTCGSSPVPCAATSSTSTVPIGPHTPRVAWHRSFSRYRCSSPHSVPDCCGSRRARRRNRAVDGTTVARSSRTSHRRCTPRHPRHAVRLRGSSPGSRSRCTTTRPRHGPRPPRPR